MNLFKKRLSIVLCAFTALSCFGSVTSATATNKEGVQDRVVRLEQHIVELNARVRRCPDMPDLRAQLEQAQKELTEVKEIQKQYCDSLVRTATANPGLILDEDSRLKENHHVRLLAEAGILTEVLFILKYK